MMLGTIRVELNNVPGAAVSFQRALDSTRPRSTSLMIRARCAS